MEVKKMSEDKVKTPDDAAETEMNKKIGKAIAKRMMKIKQLEAEIKKLKSGEMVPDEDDDESSHHNQKEEKEIKERIIERIIEPAKPIPFKIDPYPKPYPTPYPKPIRPWDEWKPVKPFYYKSTRTWTTCLN